MTGSETESDVSEAKRIVIKEKVIPPRHFEKFWAILKKLLEKLLVPALYRLLPSYTSIISHDNGTRHHFSFDGIITIACHCNGSELL